MTAAPACCGPRQAGLAQLAAVRPTVEALQAQILAPLTEAEQASFAALARKALGLD